jgi:hypothetical protein
MAGTISINRRVPRRFEISIPIEIRSASNQFVRSVQESGTFELPSGLYLVRYIRPDGKPVERVVAVDDGRDTPIELDLSSDPSSGEDDAAEDDHRSDDYPDMIDFGGTAVGDSPEGPVTLMAVRGCEVATEGQDSWTFRAGGTPERTPTAQFALADRRVIVSLPINLDDEGTTCSATATSIGGRDRIAVRFGPTRTVASALEGLLRNSVITETMQLLPMATDLLWGKYSDAPAAALGGLTLHRLGHLKERESWVENLARDFHWIPDGSILLAALLGTSNPEGDATLTSVWKERPMFTDGYALLAQLVRNDERLATQNTGRNLVVRTRDTNGVIDWDSVFFTTDHESP